MTEATLASTDVTLRLARHVIAAKAADLPAAVRKEVARALLNWVGVAVGASRHETIEIALRSIKPFAGPPQAAVLGRSERLDIMSAALLNGISSHVFDFDDTDLSTAVHPSSPVAPALLALAEYRPTTGQDFVLAMTMGSRRSAGSPAASCRRIPRSAGIQPVPAAYSAPPSPRARCWAWTKPAWRTRLAWRPPSRSGSGRCSAP